MARSSLSIGETCFQKAIGVFSEEDGKVTRDNNVTECIVICIHVPGHDPLIFSFCTLSFFDWVGVLWPQLDKVLKLVRWADSVPFPLVSLKRQVVCLLLQLVFMFSSMGRACK